MDVVRVETTAELALLFTERLLKERDLSSIVRELYVADFMRRQLEELKKSRGGAAPDDFMLDGIPPAPRGVCSSAFMSAR